MHLQVHDQILHVIFQFSILHLQNLELLCIQFFQLFGHLLALSFLSGEFIDFHFEQALCFFVPFDLQQKGVALLDSFLCFQLGVKDPLVCFFDPQLQYLPLSPGHVFLLLCYVSLRAHLDGPFQCLFFTLQSSKIQLFFRDPVEKGDLIALQHGDLLLQTTNLLLQLHILVFESIDGPFAVCDLEPQRIRMNFFPLFGLLLCCTHGNIVNYNKFGVRRVSLVLEGGAGDSHLEECLREVLVVLLQPLEMRVVVLHDGSLADESSDGLQALLGEVLADQVGQGMLTAAVEGEGELLDDLAHVGEGGVELAGHEVVVECFEDEGESVGSLGALALVLGLHEVLFCEEGALLLDLRLVDGLEHCRHCITHQLRTMICFSFFSWSSAYNRMIFTIIFASFERSFVHAGGQAVSKAVASSSAPHARIKDGTRSTNFSRESMMDSMLVCLRAELAPSQKDFDWRKQLSVWAWRSAIRFWERAVAMRTMKSSVFIIDYQSRGPLGKDKQQGKSLSDDHSHRSSSNSLGHSFLMPSKEAFSSRT